MYFKSNSKYRILYNFFFFSIPLIVLVWSIISPGIDGYDRARLGDMVIGKAHRPYVYRVLVPSMVRLIKSIVPRAFRGVCTEWIESHSIISDLFTSLRWDAVYFIEYILVIIILYLSLLAFASAIRYLIYGLSHAPEFFVDVVSLLSIAILPVMFKYYNYIYDFPHLVLFTLGLALMARHKWDLYLVVYILACFNKETTILLTMIYFIYQFPHRETSWKSFVKLLFIQGLFFVIVRLVLMFLFKDNPGSMVEFHLYDYNMILFRKAQPVWILYWLPVLFLIFHRWNEKPKLLRAGIWILVPLVGLTLFFGFLDELRDYYEAYPIVFILMVYSKAFLLKIPIHNKKMTCG